MTAVPVPTPRERAEQFLADRFLELDARPGPIHMTSDAPTVLADLRTIDPDAWEEWLSGLGVEAVMTRWRSMLSRSRTARVHSRRRAALSVFGAAATTAAVTGTPMPSVFDARYTIPGCVGYIRLGQMRRRDLLAVSRNRSTLSRTHGIEAVFMRALADVMPNDEVTVDETFDEAAVEAIAAKAEATSFAALPDDEDTDDE